MQHTSFGVVLCLWLELAALMAPASASPSFRFEKASSNHHDVSAPVPSASPSNTSHTVDLSESDIPIDASKLCPLSFNQKDAGNERKMKHDVARLRSSKNNGFAKATIPLIFHVVAADNSVDGGHVSHHNLEQQVKILNQDFASANIEFKLEKINRISNKKWFLDVGYADKVAQEMHASTREGDAKTLNVWTTSFSKVSFTGGYAQYPWDYQRQPKDDGITIRHDFLYGSKHRLFNDGRYLTHEAGHWVGLYHTFEGENCSGSGDYVDDTPAQKSPSDPGDKSCKPKDTCKEQAGQDPISNFMDYSNPGCQSAFTDGQIARMRTAIASFRDYPA